jgi:3',5'-cyclic AMP phosphodiesterase CpdA
MTVAMSGADDSAQVRNGPKLLGCPAVALRFRDDGRFTVLQITDAHLCDDGPDDRKTRELIERALDAERPDLVVLTGDFVDGRRALDPARVWRDGVAAIDARGLPWAAVFGNHDDEGAASREDLFAVWRESPLCLSERGAANLTGIGNYVLDIGASRSPLEPAAHLYFFDSGSYSPTGAGIYAWIAHDQIAWYRQVSRRRNDAGESGRAALAFFHIPLPEYLEAWNAGDHVAEKHEDVFCPKINSGLFAAFHERGEVLGTFCGHDHANDFEARLHGLRLCYGRATGYNAYGHDGFPRGVRVIELVEGQRDFKTWLRLDVAGLPRVEQAVSA